MTLAELRTQAREFARADTTATSDVRLNEYIQNAVDRFSRDVNGFPMDVNLQIAAAFDTETHFAFHVTITEVPFPGGDPVAIIDQDVVITATAREDATGTTVASDLQTALRAMTGAVGTETVTWANFYFTIDFKQGPSSEGSIIISAPDANTYTNALTILGLQAGTTTDSNSVTGGFPQGCTKYVKLPSDAIAIDRVEWDYDELVMTGLEWVQSSEDQGDPTHFAIRGRRLYLTPSPDRQDRLEVWYRGQPTQIVFSGYQELDITGLSPEDPTGLSPSTQYSFNVSNDGGPSLEYDITTASDTSYNAVILLMNTEVNNKATFSITTDGKFRCTSDNVGQGSSISLAAGDTAPDLFAALTGWNEFETANASDINLPTEVPSDYEEALVWLTALYLARASWDTEAANICMAEYRDIMRRYRMHYANLNTTIEENFHRGYPRVGNVIPRQGF